MATRGKQRTYDHRLRNLVRETGDVTIATRLGVPRSTAAHWAKGSNRAVVTAPEFASADADRLRAEVGRLRKQAARLTALLRVLFAVLRICRVELTHERLPGGDDKRRLLRAIGCGSKHVSLRKILRALGLSSSRFHAWKRSERDCELDDQASCPKSTPQSLTPDEIRTIRDLVTSPDYRHVPTGTLAVLAQRLGRVFASPSTWRRLARERGWRRPRLRVHPAKPKVGIRASAPDEMWHIDTTVLRLVNGTRAYLHAVIDNFSRRILSWVVTERFDTGSTEVILRDAAQARESKQTPTVMADAGVENCNQKVDGLIECGLIHRVIAMTELCFSNSMIEAWWRSLKHQWLYLHCLDDFRKLEPLIRFYVDEHNSKLPHSAFRGETPDEIYFGTGKDVAAQLASTKQAARHARLEANRSRKCGLCEAPAASSAA